jgi:DNA-binding transcriptional LysR family regulator
MVAAGLGVAIVPTAVATPGPNAEATETRPLNEQWARRQLAICVRNPAKLSTACRLFISHLIGQKGRWKHSLAIAEPIKNKRSSSSFRE